MDGSSAQAYIRWSWVLAVFFGLAVFLLPGYARAASLFILPSAKSVTVGQTFTLSADVSSADEAMNAASGDISFSSDKLQVLSVSTANSVMNLWIRNPSFTNSQVGGDVHFEGVVLNPGFIGDYGNLVTITFEAIATGDAPITFTSGEVLANDGNGTNILNLMQSGDVTIASHGTTTATPPISGQAPASGSTPATEHPLGPLTLSEVPSQDPTDPRPIFTWTVGGAVAQGITYTAKIGDGDWFDASALAVQNEKNEYQLPLQAPTIATKLTVIASDPAGNSASTTILFSVTPIPNSSIADFTRKIPSSNQLFSVEGTAPTGTTIHVYLQKSGSILTYIAQTDNTGHWSVAGEDVMTPGTWSLSAQAVDARGALSALTPQYSIKVNSWFDDLYAQILDWGLIGLVAILLFGAVIFLALLIIHQIRKWRVSSDTEIVELENRLRNDLRRIEMELNQKEPAKPAFDEKTASSPSPKKEPEEELKALPKGENNS